MAENEEMDATPVAPPPHEVSPSATGLVAGDAEEVGTAPVDPDERT